MRWPWPIALGGSVLTGAFVLVGIALMAFVPTRSTVAWAAIAGVVAVLCAVLGALVARRVRDNAVGPLLVGVGAATAFTATREIGFTLLAQHPATAVRLNWLVALLAESSAWLFVALALLLLCFPDGRLPGPRWRPVPPALVLTGLAHQAYGAVDPAAYQPPLQGLPHHFGRPPILIDVLSLAADVTLLLLLIACAASLRVRYRRADEQRRRQLKWLALAGFGVPGFLVACGSEVLLTGGPGWLSLAIGIASGLGIPIAVAIAMLRHDLYDVDRALATTVAYALATTALVTIFLAALLTAGLLLGHDSTLAAAAATGLAAVALSPLRRRLQRRVDRRLYPLRGAALAAIEDLQRNIHVGAARPEQLAERLRVALRDPGLRVGYLTPSGTQLVDESGVSLVAAAGSVPVVTADATIGALLPTSSILSPELLRQVAAACATLVELVRLRLELSAALREVEASRARLVQVGDQERRRLERDLHDGAQQRLVSLGMALRVAQRHLDDSPDMHGLIDQTVAELGTAVAELRQIAHGLRPSSLDDGLHVALAALTQHIPIRVDLHVQPEPLPDDVTTTVYYVASEAIANAVKHADATRIDVHIARSNGSVEVRVADDGRGGATVAAGSGLAGLIDRVSAVGGRLALESHDQRGTVVEATVPCAS